MEILKKAYILILAASAAGCQEELVLDINPDPVLCVNSLVKVGERLDVSVTHSWLYSDEKAEANHSVDDAKVTVYANGQPVDDSYLPDEGDHVRIVAESPTYGMAEAEVTVPVGVPIGSLSWEAAITNVEERQADGHVWYVYHINLKAIFTISDQAGTRDYYQFSYLPFPLGVESDGTPVDHFRVEGYMLTDPVFSEQFDGLDMVAGKNKVYTLFTDRQFDGRPYTLNFEFWDITLTLRDDGITDDNLDCGLELTLSTVSPSFYAWNIYRMCIHDGTLWDMSNFGFADPVWGYSNVSTGAGVVASTTSRTATISLHDFLQDQIHGNVDAVYASPADQ